jgi:hypothetical protein
MNNRNDTNKQGTFFGIVVAFILTGCASLLTSVPTPELGTFTQKELNEARRIRNDPRLYGVSFDAEQYAKYLKATGQKVE